MHFVRCIAAEWSLLRPAIFRSRLGLWLVALGVVLVWLRDSAATDPLMVALRAGALGAVLCASSVGSRLSLAHPTTPLAAAAGQWLGAALPAAGLAIVCAFAAAGPRFTGAALAGCGAAAAAAGCAVALSGMLGRGALAVLFLCMVAAGAAPPEDLVAVAEPGALRLAAASALELGPALWRYRDIARLDGGAIVHAVAWAALGIAVTGGTLRRGHAHAAD